MPLRQLFLIVATALTVAPLANADDARIKYPAGYEQSFTNYLSLDRTQNPDQLIRLFANDVAMKGVAETGEFPDGSVLVAEIYKAKKDANGAVVTSRLGRRLRGNLALIAVMEKQPGWGDKFPAALKNGDWDFEAFKPDGTRAAKNLDSCRACHAPLHQERYVFSYDHLK